MNKIVNNVEVGKSYRISPSEGYAGIIPGVVEVTEIGLDRDLVDNEAINMMEEYRNTLLIEAEDEQDIYDIIWVAYKYPDAREIDYNEGIWVFPIDEFIRHTSSI